MNEQRSTRPPPLQRHAQHPQDPSIGIGQHVTGRARHEPEPRPAAADGAGIGIADSEKRLP